MASFMRPAAMRQVATAARMAKGPAVRSAFVQPAINNFTRATAFHTTSKRDILPPPPHAEVVLGGVNDPAPVPAPSPSHGSYHWTFERLLAAGLVPLTLTPFAAGSLNPTLDAILCAGLILHSHLGFQAIIVDYVPAKRFPKSRKGISWGLNAATALVGLGLYEFETNDVGITEALKRVWTA
ncbi:succinate dehydrogenase membrane anchor subunit [Verticillium alfalfae VaMs.102]|uniref:Succinate dehydrogenase [ubiquinone] cytochrome b small subunit n=1 Tax=Verticillium alfalfae (strain VaMs.102 / ATCC MYA-4576 / FGSC 10136) TaxID=526221 RepID=C9SGV2_VERA1|nr:succinate dehydrogenase membrane anchor subunit [Verticillium alfalfae VaMs.102]EEY17574.1 succinate dehydrogenase membrane anchor subunit [Verticillium alfalfae VaMs.102]